MSETVNHPSYYNRGKIEVIEFIDDQQLNFSLGSAVKYICRAGYKHEDATIEDLEKALWYIQHEISQRRMYMQTSELQEEEGVRPGGRISKLHR